jgi:hypothetical protein
MVQLLFLIERESKLRIVLWPFQIEGVGDYSKIVVEQEYLIQVVR